MAGKAEGSRSEAYIGAVQAFAEHLDYSSRLAETIDVAFRVRFPAVEIGRAHV